jgi:hypothetical protein
MPARHGTRIVGQAARFRGRPGESEIRAAAITSHPPCDDERMRRQPDLKPADDSPAPAPGLPGREAMCRMTDGTWQLVRVAWQPAGPGRWRCLLRWGEWGVIREGWYTHDPAILVPENPARQLLVSPMGDTRS